MAEVNMPRLSDTMQEGTIARWLKKQGDEVKKGDVLAEIETDKATMDLEAYDAGVIEQILVQEGESAPIGKAVAVIGSGTGGQKQEQAAAATSTPQGAKAEQSSTEMAQKENTDNQKRDAGTRQKSVGTQEKGAGRPEEDEGTQKEVTETAASTQKENIDTGEGREDGLIKASPLARRMAEEHNIDLHQVKGSGPGGRIVRDDIEDLLEQRGATPAQAESKSEAAPQEIPAAAAREGTPTPSPAEEVEVSALSRRQVIIAQRLSQAKQTIPHFYVSNEVDMTDVLAMRQVFNANAGEDGAKITVNDLIVKACALALEKFPEVNSSYREGQILRHKRIHVGIAVDVPAGLVVPVIRDTNIKGVRAIAREAKALIEKARTNKLSTVDLEGGTFSVSNLGMMDVTEFIAVINPPQAAILAVASARKVFVPVNDQPVIRDMMEMTVSADHRIIYGATVARFLQEVKRLLQNPYSLLG